MEVSQVLEENQGPKLEVEQDLVSDQFEFKFSFTVNSIDDGSLILSPPNCKFRLKNVLY